MLEQVLAEKNAATKNVVLMPAQAGPMRPAAAPLATAPAPAPRDDADDNLLNQWWFWAAAGGVAVVGVVVIAVVAGSGGDKSGGELTKDSTGVTIAVLSLE